MRGSLNVKAGRYSIGDNVDLVLKASDEGTILVLDYLLIKRKLVVVLNENGLVRTETVEGPPRKPKTLSPPAEPKDGTPVMQITHTPPSPAAVGRKSTRSKRRIRFKLLYSKKARPVSRPFVLGGFMDGMSTHVLYRVESAGHIYYEGQIRINGDDVCRVPDIPDEEQLPRAEWQAFIDLPCHTTFSLHGTNTHWRKMSNEELVMLVEGQTLRLNEDR